MCSLESEIDLSTQFSNIAIVKNEVNEIQSLIDLPNDIITAIIEEDSFTLEDRMNLRLTCKKMESIVAESEFKAVSKLVIHKMPIGSKRNYLTSISLLYDMTDEPTIPEGRHSSLIHLMSRLFRRAHFDCIHIENFDFRSDAPSNLMNVDQLLQLIEHFTCKDLRLDISRPYYDARIFDVIGKLKPSEDLCLIAATSLNIDQELLKNLPPVPTLRFQTSKSSFFMISDETILALISKHSYISLGERAINVQPETLLEATKVIAVNGHMLLLTLRISLVTQMLHLIDVTYHGTSMTTSNPEVRIHRKVTVINCFHSSVDSSDFAIDVFDTKMTIYGMLTGVQQRDQELVVEIGLKN